jgi:hypothetical protein
MPDKKVRARLEAGQKVKVKKEAGLKRCGRRPVEEGKGQG